MARGERFTLTFRKIKHRAIAQLSFKGMVSKDIKIAGNF